MKIYSINTKVRLNNEIDGIIKKILIEQGGISYNIAYWNGRSYCSEHYFLEDEFTTDIKQKTTIGFNIE